MTTTRNAAPTRPAHDAASPAAWIERACRGVLGFELLLGVAHLLWPEYRWGQGRASYFHFANSLTLASWLASMQLAGVAGFAGLAFQRELPTRGWRSWPWLAGALVAVVLSVAEMTRFHHRFGLVNRPEPDPFRFLLVTSLVWMAFGAFAGALILRARGLVGSRTPFRGALAWTAAWGIALALRAGFEFLPDPTGVAAMLPIGLGHLLGSTFLLAAVAGYALRLPVASARAPADDPDPALAPWIRAAARPWVLAGVFGVTFTIVFLQVLLLRLLSIFGNYLAAHAIIAIALLGISVGGLVGFLAADRAPVPALVGGSLLLPVSVVFALASVASIPVDSPWLPVALMLPFAASSSVITVALARSESHRIYAIDLLGAAAGALAVSFTFGWFREEGSGFVLAGFACLAAAGFVQTVGSRGARLGLSGLCLAGVATAAAATAGTLRHEWLNVGEHKIRGFYKQAEVYFSRSSFVGRYDVGRRKPEHRDLSTFENGQITDNLRNWPVEDYRIDPRMPHTLMDDPTILILGLSGDGVTKTARAMGAKVYGVEINPTVVEMQTNELRPFNHDSYRDIEVAVMDGRSYIERSTRRYDIITLMNAHLSRGSTSGRSPSPEYLHTREAIDAYLDRLTDRGILNVEESVGSPMREPPVWKLLWTMREALLARGIAEPERHFFVFQWRTRRNNYVQILVKKTAFTESELIDLRAWLEMCDRRKELEDATGRRLGPITTKTTLLHAPDEPTDSNCSRVIRGEVGEGLQQARSLRATTDDRPFHFDVDPERLELRGAYVGTLWLLLLLLPGFGVLLARYRGRLRRGVPHLLVVALTGFAYFLIEVALIQRYAIFLGSPTVTFTAVLGTLLAFSGLGSLWSGRLGDDGAFGSVLAALGLLGVQLGLVPALLSEIAGAALPVKVAVAIVSIAPLAFLMGVPFPYVMRSGQSSFGGSAAAMLFAVNGAASAVAVPLSMNLSVAWGFRGVLLVGLAAYAVVALLLAARRRPRVSRPAHALAVALVAALLVSPWALVWAGGGLPEADGRWRVYALDYGWSDFPAHKVFADGSREEREFFRWAFWLIRGQGRTILVDTGFEDPELAADWRIRGYALPSERLRSLGIEPDQVTDVILTHAHWDHVGGLASYAGARVWIQDAEYRHALDTVSEARPKARGLRWEDVRVLAETAAQGRLERLDGRREILPGVTLVPGGGHTPGSQYVLVETLDGTIVLAGDVIYRYENNAWHRPSGSTRDPEENLRTIREMQRTAASPSLIIPGHEYRVVMGFFAPVADGVVEITTVPEASAP
jgi:glyoxylase-like metal-dependent hydrolase (beta-lactamase superfamily II)/predicted membrane-bound spermidine synthase